MNPSKMEPVFSFPFKPYAIQETFMSELYSTIEDCKLGIFESPTGTGKSLSICCGALQWLKDYNQKNLEALEKDVAQLKLEISSKCTTDDWLQEEYEKIKKTQLIVMLQNKLDKIKKRNEKFNEMRLRNADAKHKTIGTKTIDCYFQKGEKIKEELANNYYDMDSVDEKENCEEISDKDLLLEEIEDNEESAEEEITEDEEDNITKIYISSRTHSQLSQFVGEIKRTAFKESRVVTLASRQHYCINSDVNRLKNANLINERCLDLQKSKSKSSSVGEDGKVLKKTKTKSCAACPYYNQSNITKLKERLLVDVMDMEDLVKSGKELKACPYYASRLGMGDAEVVLISHAGVVNSGTRSGLSVKLKDNILILDEAHGLTAALENAHSAPVTAKQLGAVKTYLNFYINKYRSKLGCKNLLSLNQLSFVVGKLLGMITPKTNDKQRDDTAIFTLEDFVIKAEIDHMNLRPLVEFCKATRLAPKLHGFSMRYSQQDLEQKTVVHKKSSFESFLNNMSKKKDDIKTLGTQTASQDVKPNTQVQHETSAGSGLYSVLDLLDMLSSRTEAGRVLATCKREEAGLKYVLLQPATCFADVVNQCRSVIVAGGTMEPISEFQELLTTNPTKMGLVNVVRCGHVVPPDNVLAVCLSKGPSNVNLNFSYENRMSEQLLTEVGRILRNICSIVPGGIVCFLPSYSYEQAVYDSLKCGLIDAIGKKKVVFREPKSASEVDQTLQKFAAAVKNRDNNRTGALLLSVVGGKLSEGLNFSDELGRCVMVVGMPYPNVSSPELREKMSYLNRIGAGAGSRYYDNLCMKAVNQCIGRAVRHANDYASVLLVDERYSRAQTIAALPSFVQKSLLADSAFGPTIANIAKFFSRHKEHN